MLDKLGEQGINAVFHYVPLHSSPYGKKCGRSLGTLPHTVDLSSRLLRLPLWVRMTDNLVNQVIETVSKTIKNCL